MSAIYIQYANFLIWHAWIRNPFSDNKKHVFLNDPWSPHCRLTLYSHSWKIALSEEVILSWEFWVNWKFIESRQSQRKWIRYSRKKFGTFIRGQWMSRVSRVNYICRHQLFSETRIDRCGVNKMILAHCLTFKEIIDGNKMHSPSVTSMIYISTISYFELIFDYNACSFVSLMRLCVQHTNMHIYLICIVFTSVVTKMSKTSCTVKISLHVVSDTFIYDNWQISCWLKHSYFNHIFVALTK